MKDVVFSPTRHRFTVKDYHRMAEAEVFDPEDRVELVDGEVLEMAPIDSRHAGCVNRLNYLFVSRLGERAVIAPQNPVEVDDYSEPQPDLVVLRARDDFYSNAHPARRRPSGCRGVEHHAALRPRSQGRPVPCGGHP